MVSTAAVFAAANKGIESRPWAEDTAILTAVAAPIAGIMAHGREQIMAVPLIATTNEGLRDLYDRKAGDGRIIGMMALESLKSSPLGEVSAAFGQARAAGARSLAFTRAALEL